MKLMADKTVILLIGLFCIIFGIATILGGGFALFGGSAGKLFAGDFIPIVLWFNFFSGFFYVVAGVGIMFRKLWSTDLAILIASSTITMFVVFGTYVLIGVHYEFRTVIAMAVRSTLWVVVSFIGAKRIGGHLLSVK